MQWSSFAKGSQLKDTWSPGKRQVLRLSQHDSKRKKKKRKTKRNGSRNTDGGLTQSLAVSRLPLSHAVKPQSRFYPGFIGRLCCENSIFLPRSEFLLNAQFWYYISNLHWWTQDNNSKLNSVSTLGWHFAHSVSRCSFRELSFVLITRSANCKMSD